LLNDLSHGLEGEVNEDLIHNGAAARHGRSDRDASLAQFTDPGIAKPMVPELLPESASLAKIAAARPNALPDVHN
jgi:hypothetical protein